MRQMGCTTAKCHTYAKCHFEAKCQKQSPNMSRRIDGKYHLKIRFLLNMSQLQMKVTDCFRMSMFVCRGGGGR